MKTKKAAVKKIKVHPVKSAKRSDGVAISQGKPKKTKTVAAKKTVKKVSTVSAAKKVVKKTKTAAAPKRKTRKTVAIAAPKKLHVKTLTSAHSSKPKRKIGLGLKRATYMVLAITVGVLSAAFVLGFIEMVYLKNSFETGAILTTHRFLGMQTFILPIFSTMIFAAGLCFGVWLGFWGWRVVYIEHRHRMYRK